MHKAARHFRRKRGQSLPIRPQCVGWRTIERQSDLPLRPHILESKQRPVEHRSRNQLAFGKLLRALGVLINPDSWQYLEVREILRGCDAYAPWGGKSPFSDQELLCVRAVRGSLCATARGGIACVP